MLSWLIVSKIIVSIVFVVGLSLVAENVSPRAAGILAGYPLGTAISLFFIGLENGTDFAAQSAIYTVGGLSAALVFVCCYYYVSMRFQRGQIISSSLGAIAGFLLIAKGLSLLRLNLSGAVVLTFGSILFFAFLFRHIPDVLVKKKVGFTYMVLFLRALIAALIILFVTGIASWVGPGWAGILSAFPVTLFPLLVLIHFAYGKAQVHTIIKNFPFGLGALITYTVTVHFLYPPLGVPLGTVLSFAMATMYLLLFSYLSRQLKINKTQKG